MDTRKLREIVDGFTGRFFYDEERGDIGYIAKKCDDRQCDCSANYNADGEQDCSVALFDDTFAVDDVGQPIVEMLNAAGPLLAALDQARAALDEANRDCVGLRAVYEAAQTWCETVYIGKPHPRFPAYPGDELLLAVNAIRHARNCDCDSDQRCPRCTPAIGAAQEGK